MSVSPLDPAAELVPTGTIRAVPPEAGEPAASPPANRRLLPSLLIASLTLFATYGGLMHVVDWFPTMLDMAGITTVPLSSGADLIPTAAAAEALITPKTKAIVLVSPNNPGGVEYPAQTLTDFRDLARRRGLVLIVDETYRDFDARTGAPHELIADPDWDDTLIQLYSFSKAYRLTGHRVGAILWFGGTMCGDDFK
jgi:hypothetical protein